MKAELVRRLEAQFPDASPEWQEVARLLIKRDKAHEAHERAYAAAKREPTEAAWDNTGLLWRMMWAIHQQCKEALEAAEAADRAREAV